VGGGYGRHVLTYRDRVEWGEEQEKAARAKVEENSDLLLSDDLRG
jgi:hypothetical protein